MDKIDTFTHCHLHTSFGSFLDGVGKPIEYMKRAAELGQKAVCVTDSLFSFSPPIKNQKSPLYFPSNRVVEGS